MGLSLSLFHRKTQPIVLVIEGVVGAGKTNLLSVLTDYFTQQGLKVCAIPEPVDLWEEIGILKKFYSDIPRYAYEFQTFTFVSRLKKIIEYYETNSDADIYILERSIFSDRHFFVEMLHQQHHLDDVQMKMYEEWWEMWYRINPLFPSAFVYLKPSLDECMKRVKTRARDGEETVGEEYQQKLLDHHDKFFNGNVVEIRGVPIPFLTLTTDEDFRSNESVQKEIGDQINEFLMVEID